MTYLSPEGRRGFGQPPPEVMTQVDGCPACSVQGSWTKPLTTRAGTVYFCGECGLGRRSEIDGKENLRLFLSAPDLSRGVEHYVADEPARRMMARNLLSLIGSRERGKLLEFGSHVGFLLNEAKLRGWRVCGVDANPVAVAWGRQHLQLAELQEGLLEEFSFEGHQGQYDAVVLANFLGHVEKPDEAVRKCFWVLKPGGVLAIQTPDLSNPWMRLPKNVRGQWRYFIGSYFWYFNQKSLTRLLTKSGFDVPYIGKSRRPIPLGLVAERALGTMRTDMLEPIERASHRSMTGVYAQGQRAISLVRASRLGSVSIDMGFLGDSLDIIGQKPLR